jgi:hypothetical protein
MSILQVSLEKPEYHGTEGYTGFAKRLLYTSLADLLAARVAAV